MLKKIILGVFTIFILVGCSGVEAKEGFYNNSVMIQLDFSEGLTTFENGFADITIWKYKVGEEKIASSVKSIIYDNIEHSQGNNTKKRLLINVSEPFEEEYNYYVLLKIYKDSNRDGRMEVIYGKSFGKNNGVISNKIKEVRFYINE